MQLKKEELRYYFRRRKPVYTVDVVGNVNVAIIDYDRTNEPVALYGIPDEGADDFTKGYYDGSDYGSLWTAFESEKEAATARFEGRWENGRD